MNEAEQSKLRELEAENRYLLAVPAAEKRFLPEYAEWFDLTDRGPIYLPLGTVPEEEHSLIKIEIN